MSNSNGMYRVLDVFKKLEPVEQPTAKQQAQAIYESVEARGSILEGIGRVEKKLAEQFASFKEGEKVPVKGGMVHKGTYGNSYDGDEPAASDGPKKRGRPPKGTPKKAAPAGEKRGRGRPKKDTSTELKTKGGDIFGRTTGAIPKGKKGTVIKGKGNIDESRLLESFNFAEMAKDTDMSVSEMLETIQNDIKVFKETGMCSDTLEAFLKVHNHGKKKLNDAINVPRGPSFAPQHADIPPAQQKPGVLDRVKGAVKTGLEKLGHPDDAGMRADLQKKMGVGEELNELARLAGISGTKNEGNAFTGKLAATKKGDSFELDGKTFTDHSSLDEENTDEGNAFTGKLAATKKGDSFELDGKKYKDTSGLDETKSPKADKDYDKDGEIESEKDEVIGSRRKAAGLDESAQIDECGMMSPIGSAAQSMEQQQGKISVNTNMSSDGNKSVSINADGDAAEQLMQMLKMAGLGGGEAHAKLAIAVPAGEVTDELGGQEMEEATEQYANTPDEEYAGVDTITNQGDDMNRQKKQFANMPRQGDNPMATQPMAEEIDPIGTLGRDLMKEYQALKLAK